MPQPTSASAQTPLLAEVDRRKISIFARLAMSGGGYSTTIILTMMSCLGITFEAATKKYDQLIDVLWGDDYVDAAGKPARELDVTRIILEADTIAFLVFWARKAADADESKGVLLKSIPEKELINTCLELQLNYEAGRLRLPTRRASKQATGKLTTKRPGGLIGFQKRRRNR